MQTYRAPLDDFRFILDVLGYYGCLSDCVDYDTNEDGVVGAPD